MNNAFAEETIEYQIYIGCNDSQIKDMIVSDEELKAIIHSFFKQKKVDFSLMHIKGGYLHGDGGFILENALCISIIGNSEDYILKLAKSLSMLMNQEEALVVKSPVKIKLMKDN